MILPNCLNKKLSIQEAINHFSLFLKISLACINNSYELCNQVVSIRIYIVHLLLIKCY